MKYFKLLLCLLAFLFFTSCEKDKTPLYLDRIENTLPGDWKIVSYRRGNLRRKVYFEGKVVPIGSIFLNIGSLYIPPFSVEDLNLYDQRFIPLACVLTIDQESFAFRIDYLLPREFGLFLSIRANFSNPNSDTEKFVTSSNIFDDNFEVYIENENRIVFLHPGNELEGQKIVLERR